MANLTLAFPVLWLATAAVRPHLPGKGPIAPRRVDADPVSYMADALQVFFRRRSMVD